MIRYMVCREKESVFREEACIVENYKGGEFFFGWRE